MSPPAIGLPAALAMAAQDPGDILGRWDKKPTKVPTVKDLGAEAAEEKRIHGAVVAAGKLGGDHLLLASLLEEVCVYYVRRKRCAEAEPLLRRAPAIREKDQGPDHRDVAETLAILAMCRMAATETDADTAEPMLRRALAILEKSSKDGPEVAKALHVMAMVHMARRELDAAESDLSRALAIREKTAGPDSEKVANLLDDLGGLQATRATPLGWEDLNERADGTSDRLLGDEE